MSQPKKKIDLEFKPANYSTRIIDMFVPQGFGQRCLIVAPPKSGKTVLLQNVANAITTNQPDVKLFFLSIDEEELIPNSTRHQYQDLTHSEAFFCEQIYNHYNV